MARTSFTLVTLAIAGAMAMLLKLIGIYGVIAYAVSQRTRAIGTAIGTGAAVMLTPFMKSLLYCVAPMDLMTFAAVPATLLLATLVASYLPARRVSEVDPVNCMRRSNRELGQTLTPAHTQTYATTSAPACVFSASAIPPAIFLAMWRAM